MEERSRTIWARRGFVAILLIVPLVWGGPGGYNEFFVIALGPFPKGRLTNCVRYAKTDMEARCEVERIPRTSPQRITRWRNG